jgi:hypothetical protein
VPAPAAVAMAPASTRSPTQTTRRVRTPFPPIQPAPNQPFERHHHPFTKRAERSSTATRAPVSTRFTIQTARTRLSSNCQTLRARKRRPPRLRHQFVRRSELCKATTFMNQSRESRHWLGTGSFRLMPTELSAVDTFTTTSAERRRPFSKSTIEKSTVRGNKISSRLSSSLGAYKRGVAQLGSAPALGAGGRKFESCRPDTVGVCTEEISVCTRTQ